MERVCFKYKVYIAHFLVLSTYHFYNSTILLCFAKPKCNVIACLSVHSSASDVVGMVQTACAMLHYVLILLFVIVLCGLN